MHTNQSKDLLMLNTRGNNSDPFTYEWVSWGYLLCLTGKIIKIKLNKMGQMSGKLYNCEFFQVNPNCFDLLPDPSIFHIFVIIPAVKEVHDPQGGNELTYPRLN